MLSGPVWRIQDVRTRKRNVSKPERERERERVFFTILFSSVYVLYVQILSANHTFFIVSFHRGEYNLSQYQEIKTVSFRSYRTYRYKNCFGWVFLSITLLKIFTPFFFFIELLKCTISAQWCRFKKCILSKQRV